MKSINSKFNQFNLFCIGLLALTLIVACSYIIIFKSLDENSPYIISSGTADIYHVDETSFEITINIQIDSSKYNKSIIDRDNNCKKIMRIYNDKFSFEKEISNKGRCWGYGCSTFLFKKDLNFDPYKEDNYFVDLIFIEKDSTKHIYKYKRD